MKFILMNAWAWRTLRYALLFWVVLATWTRGDAQTPGGVSGNLRAWYQADRVPSTNGTGITNDLPDCMPSGGPGDARYIDTSAYQATNPLVPRLPIMEPYHVRTADFMNGRHMIELKKGFFACPVDINSTVSGVNTHDFTEMHVFVAYFPRDDDNPINNPPPPFAIWGNGPDVTGNNVPSHNIGRHASVQSVSNGDRAGQPNGRVAFNFVGANQVPYINHININDDIDSVKVFINGNDTFQAPLAASTLVTSGNLYPGFIVGMDRIRDAFKPRWNLGEIILYSDSLTELERQKITTHMGVRYGLSLEHDYVLSNDSVAWDYNHAGALFNHNIIAIANDSAIANHGGALRQISSTSQYFGDVLTISATDTSFYDGVNRRSLVVGHNNSTTNTSPISLNQTPHFFAGGERIARVWRCEQRGGYNDYRIQFKPNINLPNNFGANEIVMLVADDEGFTTNVRAIRIPEDANGNGLIAESVSFSNSQHSVHYITIAKLDAALWVKADGAGNVFNNEDVVRLIDQVYGINDMFGRGVIVSNDSVRGRSADLPNLWNSTSLPSGVNSEMNFNPYIKFNEGTEHTFIERLRVQGFGNNENTVFLIVRRDLDDTVNSSGQNESFLSYASRNNNALIDNTILIDKPDNVRFFVRGTDRLTGLSIENNLPSLIANFRGNNQIDSVYINDKFSESNGNFRLGAVIPPDGTLAIGQELDAIDDVTKFELKEALHGDLAELIVLSKRLNLGDIQKVRSYLSIKYGIFLESNFDYVLSDGTVSWSRNNNNNYHKNIAGIGQDNAFQLHQIKSRAQRPPSDSVVLTISTSGFSQDRSHLIWGASTTGVYDSFSTVGAPVGVAMSGRHWKIQNYQSRVGAVTLQFDVPSTAINVTGAGLIISNDTDFSDDTTIAGTFVNGLITFTGVTFQDSAYFTLGFETDFDYANNDPGAPPTYEACKGSDVFFRYTDIAAIPDRVQFRSLRGGNATVEVPRSMIQFSDTVTTTGPPVTYSGLMRFIIPDSAATGTVSFLGANGNILSTTPEPLIVHNPEVDFYTTGNPVCADTVLGLVGFPNGGRFSSLVDTAILVDSTVFPHVYRFDGREAGWGPDHQDFIDVPVTYTYTAKYTTGESCRYDNTITKDINVRDNRLYSINYAPQYTIPGQTNPPVPLGVNGSIIRSSEPNLTGSLFQSPFLFAGPNIIYSTNPTEYRLVVATAPRDNQIFFQFNNNGCYAELYDTINVYSNEDIAGLEPALCRRAAPIRFYRDTTNLNTRYALVNGNIERNRIDTVIAVPSMPGAVTEINNTTPGLDTFLFDPSVYGPSVDSVSITIFYSTGPVGGAPISTFRTTGTVQLIEPTLVRIDTTIAPFYCVNDDLVPLESFPRYSAAGNGRYRIEGEVTLGNFVRSTAPFTDSTLVTQPHYDNLLPAANQDLNIRLIYTVDQFGCVNSDTAYTRFIAPITVALSSASPFCLNEPNGIIQANVVGSAVRPGVGFFDATTYVDSLGNFNAQVAGPGAYVVNYRVTDLLYNCETVYSHDVLVRRPPQVDLLLDSTRNTSFCGSDTSITMSVLVDTLGLVDSIYYFGAGVFDAIFNPNVVFRNLNNGTSGTSILWTLTVDTFGCQNADTVNIRVIEPPRLDLDVAFNNRRFNQNLLNAARIPHAYCHDEARISIYPSPSHLDPTATGWLFQGDGMLVVGDSVYFYPDRTVSGAVNQVYYTYTDSIGCSNTDSAFIQIDTIPDVQLTGLGTEYCQDPSTISLVGTPNSNLASSAQFSGSGVNASTGAFDPSQANTGTQMIRYTFTTREGCTAMDEDTVVIHPLPIASFTLPQPQYCTNDSSVQLIVNNDTTPPNRYYFWGTNLVDSSGLLTPDTAFVGPQVIHYTYIDINGCSNTDNQNVFIIRSPEITVANLEPAYCFNGGNVELPVSPNASLLPGSASNFGMSANTLTIYPDRDSAGMKRFTLVYRDRNGCVDILSDSTFLHRPAAPQYSGLDSLYCENRDTFLLTRTLASGRFYGPGIIQATPTDQGFVPLEARGGIHTITYVDTNVTYYNNNMDTLACVVDTQAQVRVRPLPNPSLTTPANNDPFCTNDGLILLEPDTTVNGRLRHSFTTDSTGIILDIVRVFRFTGFDANGDSTFRRVIDTTYYFYPDTVGEGAHTVTYTATDRYGCSRSIDYTFIVDQYNVPFFPLDTVYCQSSDSIPLNGFPGGGQFTRNGTLLTAPPGRVPHFTLSTPSLDTVVYSVTDGACEGTDTVIVTVHPTPIVSFTNSSGLDTFCLGGLPDTLQASIPGGQFSGSGVPSNSTLFLPDLAGVGEHTIRYAFADSSTACASTYEDVFYVYGAPNVDFQVVGGCQGDTVQFMPSIVGVTNFFGNRVIDSLTSIQWLVEPGVVLAGTAADSNRIDSITYVYGSPGIYNTQLIVANRNYCVDTHTVRLVISPTINNFPYSEGFENGDGNWFAESNSATQRLLWEWGIDSNNTGVISGNTNHIWATGLNQAYQASDNAWVYSPCFDISSLQRPMIHFNYWSHTPDSEDGTIIEYQLADGTWKGLGKVGRGINWFNSLFIAGQPGGNNVRPIGWSGTQTSWKNGRYKLDDYRGPNNIVRLRFAFGAFNIQSTNYFDGFAFDDVWIGNRTRNVLLETSSNIGEPNMTTINAHIYNLVYHTNINRDLVAIQYHSRVPDGSDQFHLNADNISNIRLFEYGEELPGYAFINGVHDNAPRSITLTDQSFEQAMLEDPKFSITIDTFEHISNTFKLVVRVTALVDMPLSDYRTYTVITEDSLYYQNATNYPDMLQTIVRKDDEGDNSRTRAWSRGDTERFEFIWDHSNDGFINYEPGDFKAVVFIQDKQTEEVFQATTNRDVSGYWIGVDPTEPVARNQYSELTSMILFPNPARDAFNVRFEVPLSTDYQWRLVDIRGVEVQTGTATAGTELLTINSNQYPSGTYVLLFYNEHVFAQRKVIIRR